MAIVKMNKFSAIGLDTAEEALIKNLMDLGVTELNSQDSKMADEEWSALVTKGGKETEISELESQVSTVESVIKVIESHDTSKKPLFKTRKIVSEGDFTSVLAGRKDIENDVDKALALGNHLKELRGNQNKIETAVIGLTPWKTYLAPLETQETKYTYVAIGIVPASVNPDEIRNALEAVTDKSILTVVGSDEEQNYLSLIYFKEAEDEVNEVLKQHAFNRITFKDLKGTAEENIAIYNYELNTIANEVKEVEDQLTRMVANLEKIQWLHDQLIMEQDRMKARSSLLKTGRAFYLDGWVPVKAQDALKKVFEKYGCYYEVTEPDPDEETPVLLKNNSLVYPVESITELYSLPNSKEVDPTPVFSFFYVCFYGMMLGDTIYGVILTALCVFALKKYKLEGMAYKLIKTFAYCGVSTIFWGIMFGGYFGNMLPVVSGHFFGHEINIQPVWFDPLQDPMKLLIFACIFGAVHIFVGMGVKAYMELRNGQILEALNDVIMWYLFLVGLALLLFGDKYVAEGSAAIGKWLAIVGAAGILIIPVIIGKGAGKAVGLWNLYGMTGYLADILSYSRLLALGLATSVIAQVVNILGSMFGTGVFAVIMFIVVAVIGHTFNFAINGLGSYVHSSRLQYVEFFGKFFEGGGAPFKPFMNKTKYVNIVKEEN